MNKIQSIIRTMLPVASLAAVLSACEHKELCFDHTHLISVEVEFDWSLAPEADPASMAAYFFSDKGDEERFVFTDNRGGRIMIPFGNYNGIGTNNDNTDWAGLRNESDIETIETYTAGTEVLAGNGFETYSLPRARGAEDEHFISSPGMMWSARTDNIRLQITDTLGHVVFTPSEAICHYKVIINDVENLKYLHGSAIDATLTGMSEGFLHGSQQATDTHATLPFTLAADPDSPNTLETSFLTFGESPAQHYPHYLTVYLRLTDGTKWYSTFDVTRQIQTAEDPHNVTIVVSGLKLPSPILHDEGLHPDVNDWQTIEVDLDM